MGLVFWFWFVVVGWCDGIVVGSSGWFDVDFGGGCCLWCWFDVGKVQFVGLGCWFFVVVGDWCVQLIIVGLVLVGVVDFGVGRNVMQIGCYRQLVGSFVFFGGGGVGQWY